MMLDNARRFTDSDRAFPEYVTGKDGLKLTGHGTSKRTDNNTKRCPKPRKGRNMIQSTVGGTFKKVSTLPAASEITPSKP